MDIKKRVLTDADQRPVAVQIDYADWLKIERVLQSELPKVFDPAPFRGVLQLTEDPLVYQRRVRDEWS